MSSTSPRNTVAVILHGYAWLNAICGIIVAMIMAFEDVNGLIITVELAAILVASFLVYALGEIIALLHEIKLNTEKSAESFPDELPDL